MTGSLQIKDNKYYIVLNSYASGKRRQKWIRTDLPVKGNKRRAEQLLRQTIQAYERQQYHSQRCVLCRLYPHLAGPGKAPGG